jgi:2-iminobutanoate/2-iminopropanoate deaminase
LISRRPDSEQREIVLVRSDRAPDPVGPYSQAVVHGRWLFASGQIPIDPATGKLVSGGAEAQTEQVIKNLASVLEAGGSSLRRVVRSTVYLTDLSLFPEVNAVYAKYFCGEPPPARATIGVASLPLGATVEIDAIAITDL